VVGEFACSVEAGRPVGVVRVCGPLNFGTAPRLRSAVHKCLAEQPDAVVIDLSEMTAEQNVVLTLFPTLARAAMVFAGASVLLATPSRQLRDRLAEGAGTRRMFVYPSVAEALARARQARSPRRIRRRLAGDSAATESARRLARRACQQWGLADLAGRTAVVVTELVANVVLHAGTDLVLCMATRGRYLYIAVYDGSVRLARLSGPQGPCEPGRGLMVVDSLAAAWGCVPTAGGKVVWVALSTASRGPQS
jgi:hypothetical protein